MDKKLERRFRRMRHKIGSPPHDKTAFAMGALWGNKSPPVEFIGGKLKLIFLKGALYGKKEEKRAV
jgi:hypothetical protein